MLYTHPPYPLHHLAQISCRLQMQNIGGFSSARCSLTGGCPTSAYPIGYHPIGDCPVRINRIQDSPTDGYPPCIRPPLTVSKFMTARSPLAQLGSCRAQAQQKNSLECSPSRMTAQVCRVRTAPSPAPRDLGSLGSFDLCISSTNHILLNRQGSSRVQAPEKL